MSLNDLTAQELARIDAICLDYESKLRDGQDVPVEKVVEQLGGEHAEILRSELNAIREEVQRALNPPKINVPFQVSTPTADQTPTPAPPAIKSPVGAIAPTPPANSAPQTPAANQQPPVPPTSPQPPRHPVDDLAPGETTAEPIVADIPQSRQRVGLPKDNDQIGPYSLRGTIGRGGMGVVYKAVDTRLSREVAIKFLDASSHHQELNDRFEREAKAVAALSHPNIVELFDVGAFGNLPFAVMELLQGETLQERLAKGRLRTSDVRDIGAQIAGALAAAHQKDVIHRDLKPQNVMLLGQSVTDRQSASEVSRFEVAASRSERSSSNEMLRVKVFDFGLSRTEAQGLTQSDLKTRDGVILGTPGYMSPEQARGESATPAADMFSLGCILFEAFYGRPAIAGDTTAERFAATIANTPEPDPVRRRDDIDLADLIQECLSPSPADRPASAAAVADRLRSVAKPIDPVMGKLHEGYSTGELVRRHFLTMVGGGIVGTAVGALSSNASTNELREIKSLAVLSFHDGEMSDSGNSLRPEFGLPLSDRVLGQGEMLSSALVHELSKLDSIAVQPFRSMSVNDRDDIIELGKRWGVDAFITGTAKEKPVAGKNYLLLDIQIVSATTGQQLDSFKQRTVTQGSLLESSNIAKEFATKIEQSLTPTMLGDAPVNPQTYRCLIDGKVRVDPDSVSGLKKSLECLTDAAVNDELYAEPIAGVALTSMLLAVQANEKSKTSEYVLQARNAFEKALGIDEKSVDARLAGAMHAWQTMGDYDEAESVFDDLIFTNSNHWQVRHQHGLLMLAMGDMPKAKESLLRATRLNSMSAMLRVDKARASWYTGNVDAARRDAELELTKHPDSKMARGLLIDILEQQENLREAAAMDEEFDPNAATNVDAYFQQRATRLDAIPYVPYGRVLNVAILEARLGRFNQSRLADVALPTRPPMLPLLLSVHPAFSAVRNFDQARDELLYRAG